MQIYESLHNLPLDQLAEKVGGRHRLTVLISRRLRMFNAGAPYLVERQGNESLISVAAREILADKIWLDTAEYENEEVAAASDMDILGLGEDFEE